MWPATNFPSFSLSPRNYKSVVSTALFIPNVTAGDNYAQEARRGTYFGSSQEVSGGSILQGNRSTTDCRGGCSLATGSFWGLFTEDQPKQDMEAGGGFGGDRGMKEEEKMRSNTGASLCLPSVLPSCCAQCLGDPTHHISGQKKISFYLKLSFYEWVRSELTLNRVLYSLHSRNRIISNILFVP